MSRSVSASQPSQVAYPPKNLVLVQDPQPDSSAVNLNSQHPESGKEGFVCVQSELVRTNSLILAYNLNTIYFRSNYITNADRVMFSRMLQHCFAAKLQKCFVDFETLPEFSSRKG